MSEYKYRKILKILLFLVPLLPLVYSSNFFFPYVILRTVFFRTVILSVLFLWLYLIVTKKSWRELKLVKISLLYLLFLAVSTITSILGLDPYKSFWSYFERMDGLLSMLTLFFYLVLLIKLFKDEKDWMVNIRVILTGSLAVSLFGIIQKFSLLKVYGAGTARVPSTLGNPAFLAGYLLLAAGIGLYYYLHEKEKYWKYFSLCIIAIDLAVLFMTSTRSAMLGVCGAIIAALLITGVFKRGRLQKASLAALALVVAAGSLFAYNRTHFKDSNIPILRRLAVISLSDRDTANRLLTWQWAWQGIKERPVLGYGQENFEIVFNKYYTPRITENWFDRTHNVYLDLLVTSGIFGLVSYLSLFGYCLYALFRKRRSDFSLFIVFTSLLAAYFIHNFFVFDTINSNFLFIFLLAFISWPGQKDDAKPLGNIKLSVLPAVLALGLCAFILYQAAYKPLIVNRWMYNGYYNCVADPDLSIRYFRQALGQDIATIEIAMQLKSVSDIVDQDSTISQEKRSRYARLTLEALQKAERRHPNDAKVKIFLAQQILEKFPDDKELIAGVEKIALDAYVLDPGRPEATYLLYNYYLAQKDRAKAESYILGMNEKYPWFGEPRIFLAASILKDDPEKADQYFYEGVELYYRDQAIVKITGYLLNRKRYKESIPYYQKLIETNTSSYYRIDLVKVLYLTGDIDGAVEQLNIIGQIDKSALEKNRALAELVYSKYNNK